VVRSQGVAIGLASIVGPVYIAECAPNSIRAMMVVMYAIEIGVGTVRACRAGSRARLRARVRELRDAHPGGLALTAWRAVFGVCAGLWVHAHVAVVAPHAQRGCHSGRAADDRHVPSARVSALVRLCAWYAPEWRLTFHIRNRLAHYGRLDEAKETMASLLLDPDDKVRGFISVHCHAASADAWVAGDGF
jgi:hypothetical protein